MVTWIRVDGYTLVERSLPFGSRTSPFLFDLFGKAVNGIMLQKFKDILQHLDDFLSISAWTEQQSISFETE